MNSFVKRMLLVTLAVCIFFTSVTQFDAFAADNGPGQYRVSVSSTLSLRSSASTESERLALIPDGAVVTVTETSSGWGKTVYNGLEGWISLDYAIYYADMSGTEVSGDQRSAIVRTAQGEVGYKEGSNNYTKYGEWYSSLTKNTPWCAIFVSWCAYQSGISESIIPKFSFCSTGIQLFKNLGVWHEKTNFVPNTGDIIFFKSTGASSASDHVGIVVSCDGTKVYTIEGNSSDAVSERSYKLTDSYIVGYASPNYKTAPTTTATSTSTTSTTTTTISTTTTAAAPSDAEASTDSIKLTVTGSVVNVRSGAGAEFSKIAAVRRGAVFEGLGTVKDSSGTAWYKIEIDGKTGYIISSNVSAEVESVPSRGDTGSAPAEMITVTGSTVNVRSGAGTSYSVLGRVCAGNVLTISGSVEANGVTWYRLDYNGKEGYISGDYAKKVTTVQITGAVVNVRTGAGTQCARVGSVKRGQSFELTGSKAAEDGVLWYAILWNQQTVYVCSTYAEVA